MFAILLIGCTKENVKHTTTSAAKNFLNNNVIEGQITVVGNEPFTELGLMVNDSTVYMLDCSKEIKNTLLKNQGSFYKIFFTKKTESKNGIRLSVSKTEKIQK